MFWSKKEVNSSEELSNIRVLITELRQRVALLEQQLAITTTNMNSLRGLVNKKVWKESASDEDDRPQSINNLSPFNY